MQIFAPTAIFEPRETGAETRYWPMNDLAEHLCHFADATHLPASKLDEIEDMGIAVDRLRSRKVKPLLAYRDQETRAVRAVAAYRRRQAGPLHIDDVA